MTYNHPVDRRGAQLGMHDSVKTFLLGSSFALMTSISIAAPAKQTTTSPIESLAPPTPALPPRVEPPENDEGDSAESRHQQLLEKKRQQRRHRDRQGRPRTPTSAEKRTNSLLEETLSPRPRELLLELSLTFGSASTMKPREGYTVEPSVHMQAFYRYGGARFDGRVGPWFGLRVAPFVGTGYHHQRSGTYGLTYFGPMIGVGKIDPAPQDRGRYDPATGQDPSRSLPMVTGWHLGAGIAAVSRASRRDVPQAENDQNDDFGSQGVAFDAPGIWAEFRYITIHYGALSFNAVFGVQSGASKLFGYAGLGIGGWH